MEKSILKAFLSLGEKKSFSPGDVIFKEGSRSLDLCFVFKGKVGVERKISEDRYICTFTVSQGQFFGEMALFEKKKRTAQIKALSPSEIVFIKQEDFFHFINKKRKEGVDALLFIIRGIFERIEHTNKEMNCFYELFSVLKETVDEKSFIRNLGRIVAHSFRFDAYACLFYNPVISSYERLDHEGIHRVPDIFTVGSGLKEETDLKPYGVKGLKTAVTFPLEISDGPVGRIIFFKKKSFTDDEKLFLKALLTPIGSLLEALTSRKQKQYQERIKQIHFQM